MNDVRGQEMSEITLLSFSKISKIGFLQFAEKLRGVGKSYIIHKMRIQKADILWKFYWNERGQTTPFFEKIVFFTKYFSSRYFGQLIRYEYQIDRNKTKQFVLSEEFLTYFLFWLFYSLRNQRCETHFSLKKGLFSEFRKTCYSIEFIFRISLEKKNKKK